MEYLYHGSSVPGLSILRCVSQSHDNRSENVVYLTSNRAYALFYIWDAKHNNRSNKWVTCSLKEGVVRYYEQFPDQLYAFYNGVSGYIYSTIKDDTYIKASKSEMWLSKKDVYIENAEFISNVYDEILKYEQLGLVDVIRFNSLTDEEKNKLIGMMVGYIEKKNLLSLPHSEEAKFVSKYYHQAWKKAKQTKITAWE